MSITVETSKPVAVDSLDHISPLGTMQDNSVSATFNQKLFELIPANQVRLLDLGCAGGGLVRSILKAGGFAVGIEGSDFSLKCKRAEWATIPDYLFTADVTEPFTIEFDAIGPIQFDVVTGWEFFEHIAEEKIPAVVDNIRRHARAGWFIGSISSHVEPHHRTTKPKAWWVDRLWQLGLTPRPDIEDHFGNNLVRGSHEPGAESFSVAFEL